MSSIDTMQQDRVAGSEVETVDFKMVTFSLAGKDYGIDIMRVKEIAKFHQFTYVPNTAPYVRGVYNLRGDIISVIDLRLMFNLPAQQRRDGQFENGLILRLEASMLGVIVDGIDKVVGIASRHIQPPHPIFGDINVKYISGVAEHDGRLYIILDVDRIFSRPEAETVAAVGATEPHAPVAAEPDEEEPTARYDGPEDEQTVVRSFHAQGLATFTGFRLSPVNAPWFDRRSEEWLSQVARDGGGQFRDQDDAERFLAPFFSRKTGAIWSEQMAAELVALMNLTDRPVAHIWNPGASTGHESYSIAAGFIAIHPDHQVKVWASDTDLLKISNAPNLVVDRGTVPDAWHHLLSDGKGGTTFDSRVKDSILFEFSDALHTPGLPRMDVIIARDVVSFMSEENQQAFLSSCEETIRTGGLLVLGDNERPLDFGPWEELSADTLSVYRHR